MSRSVSSMLVRLWALLPLWLQQRLFKGGQRSDRLRDPDAVIAALGLRPGDRVADLGPGYGHFTLRLALAVAPDGICYAADADAETLDDLRRAADERGITNLRPVLTSRRHLELPEPVDLLFVSATYHHLRDPVRYFADAHSLLRPKGRVAILESRLEGVAARWINPHGSVPRRIRAQMSGAGYELVETHDIVYGHWFGVYRAIVRGAQRAPSTRAELRSSSRALASKRRDDLRAGNPRSRDRH
jgi:ubiquinone/menaquinone biosynthesis C-methylase UbiE